MTVPDTGVAILPAPHPPAACTGALGVLAGVVGAAFGVVVAARLVAASVEVEFGEGAAVFGLDTVRFGVAVRVFTDAERSEPSTVGVGADVPPPPL